MPSRTRVVPVRGRRRSAPLAWWALAAALLVVAQIALGIIVNLYVRVPPRHPGANPGSFTSAVRFTVWAGRLEAGPWLWPFTPRLGLPSLSVR